MEEGFKLDKESKVPIHQQLYCYIKECIENGTYKENETIPSEKEMQEMFEVSRITVRRAISDLEHDGYLTKRRGMGTVVTPRKKARDMAVFNSFSGDAKVKGDKPGSIILQCKTVEANVKVASMLQVENGEKVYFLKRLRLLNGRIIALHDTYISGRLGFPILGEDFDSTTSLYEYLEEHGIVLGSADETVEAKMPTPEIRRELFMEENQPLVYKERVTYDHQGRAVEFSENSYISDSYRYYIHINNVRGGKEGHENV